MTYMHRYVHIIRQLCGAHITVSLPQGWNQSSNRSVSMYTNSGDPSRPVSLATRHSLYLKVGSQSSHGSVNCTVGAPPDKADHQQDFSQVMPMGLHRHKEECSRDDVTSLSRISPGSSSEEGSILSLFVMYTV